MRYTGIIIFFLLLVFRSFVFSQKLELIIKVDSVKCFGENSGKIHIKVNSGVPEFTYILFNEAPWKGGNELYNSGPIISNTHTIENLFAGKYNIAVENINGIGNIKTVFINEPKELILNIEALQSGDEGILLEAKVEGGSAPYSYEWKYELETYNMPKLNVTSQGTYNCYVHDLNNCGPITKNYYYYSNKIIRATHKLIGK